MTIEECTPGTEVIWLHVPRGGYGFSMRVLARVVSASKSRVQISARLATGGTVTRLVKPDNLQRPAASDQSAIDDWTKAATEMASKGVAQRVLASVETILAPYAFGAKHEADLQRMVQAVLEREGQSHGFEPAREIRIPGGSQYDITLVDRMTGVQVVLELKVTGSASAVERQAQRYALAPFVAAVAVVTTSQRLAARIRSGTLADKPFRVITLRTKAL